MSKNIIDDLLKFAQDCNADSGYANSSTAGEEFSELKMRWEKECPGLEMPKVEWTSSGYEVKGLNVAKIQSSKKE